MDDRTDMMNGEARSASADAITASLLSSFQVLTEAVRGGSVENIGDYYLFRQNIAFPSFNSVCRSRPDASIRDLRRSIASMADAGLPFCVMLRGAASDELEDVRLRHGLQKDHDLPLMFRPPHAGTSALADGLRIRKISATEVRLHTAVGSAGFDIPADLYARSITRDVLAVEEVSCYVGEVAGVAATTAVSVESDEHTGLLNIATLPAYRRRGYGRAVTAHAMRDSAKDKGFWLQSSEAGLALYRELGFEVVEEWAFWLSA